MEKQSFSVSAIERNLKNCVISKYVGKIDKLISSDVKNINGDRDNMSIPNIDTLCFDESLLPELGKELITAYNSHFNPVYSSIIPENIKLEQAAMLDSLMFGYELSTGNINLYTLNVGVLFGLGVDNDKVIERCYERNQVGIIDAYRIDIEYESETEFLFRAVRPQKRTYLYADDYVFFPYLYVDRCMALFRMFMEKNFVLKVMQDLGDVQKERYITCSKNVLKKYSDSEEAVEGINPSYFPLKGYMYAPVIGSPSTSAMVTKVDLFSVSRVNPVTNLSDIKVMKVSDPVKNTIVIESIMKRMFELSQEDGWEYVDIMNNLPNGEKVFKDQDGMSVINTVFLSKYLHSVNDDVLDNLVREIPGCSELVEKYSKILNKYELISPSQMSSEDFRKALNDGVYRVIWLKSKGGYSSATVTNNRKILEEIYGKGYFAKYESLNVRLNMLRYRVNMGYNIGESLRYCGFPEDEELICAAEEFKNTGGGQEGSVASERFKEEVADLMGERSRSEASTGSMLARTCFAAIKPDGSVDDYYRYLSLPKITRIIRIG
jgi:hypothetical protein